jgi:hypothetical protein
MPKDKYGKEKIDVSSFTSRYEYHPKSQKEAERHAILMKAIKDLARAHYAGDVAAAAKRAAAHIGHIASYQTHANPLVSHRMRSNQRFLKKEYYPESARTLTRSTRMRKK